MKVNRERFFDNYRSLFGGSLIEKRVDGYNALFDYWENSTLNDLRWLAYALATGHHETGKRMEPVREGFCKTDECSIKAVTRLFEQGKIKRNYALPHPNGNSYFGRGLVQLTHGHNYEKLGKAIGVGMALYDSPSLALDLKISVKLMFVGMFEGLFTGHRFAQYLNNTVSDWVKARQIINGLDRAELIAGYAEKFFSCLNGTG